MGTGAAISTNGDNFKYHLPNNSSIFPAEAYSIQEATKIILNGNEKENIIYTDSISVINEIKKLYSRNPIIQQLQQKLVKAKKERNINTTIAWIPSNIGIEGNEIADKLAKEAIAEQQYIQ